MVENDDGNVRGFLSDFEFAKEMNNEISSSDPKTVCFDAKDRCCLTLDQGTPYFMPWEIHRGKRYVHPPKVPPLRSFEEQEQALADFQLQIRLSPSSDTNAIMIWNH